MAIAVVFDSAGTLLKTYRVARDVIHEKTLIDVETTELTYGSEDRVLVVLHAHSRDIMDAPPEMLLSSFLIQNEIGFGVACACRVVPADLVADVLYTDRFAHMRDLQECIRQVWGCCKKEAIVAMNSGVIVNLGLGGIEFTVTAGGRPFDGAKETISELHRMGIPVFIASGDRVTKLEKMADHLGIPRERVYGIATPSIKARIVDDLKKQYDVVVMVGDAINDLHALEKADVAILTEQQSGNKPDVLYRNADYVIKHVTEVTGLIRNLCQDMGNTYSATI
ncbi:MAG: HAD family hydrolase [Methanomicrobiaceae archaeon]|uniref:Soluble P-type atpase-like phosphatase n=1 Tax=hydrocarbon metagenome TaxID=938273 RepID=A0A0W8FF33_9ZZZZ|nr:HAD family hydrolase [Methanomicrobiaceae archaeon]MDD5419418.1 HAD family hydrolase [Methanomicrobiaceae archaeon]